MQDRIVIEEYSPDWETAFAKLDGVYRIHLSGLFEDIRHVGSTSVPGLAAKPIIDIDIVIADNDLLPAIAEKLRALGYEHRGNLGITGRDAFRQQTLLVPADGSGTRWPKHHLYVCPANSIGLRNHLALRDALRADPEQAHAYGALKKRLANQFPHDMDRYIEGKTAFITNILKDAGFDHHALETITAENRVK
jgi:GrpB-like predicted nucleotidyltransferase (UPF0157 family)